MPPCLKNKKIINELKFYFYFYYYCSMHTRSARPPKLSDSPKDSQPHWRRQEAKRSGFTVASTRLGARRLLHARRRRWSLRLWAPCCYGETGRRRRRCCPCCCCCAGQGEAKRSKGSRTLTHFPSRCHIEPPPPPRGRSMSTVSCNLSFLRYGGGRPGFPARGEWREGGGGRRFTLQDVS